MPEFRMPSLGADMDAATLVEWKAKPGEHVARGQIVAVIETDKGAIDVEMLEDGVIDALVVEPWSKVPVGTVLATFHAPGAAPAAVPAPAPPPAAPIPHAAPAQPPAAPIPNAAPAPAVSPAPAAATPPAAPSGPTGMPARSSPAARHRAAVLGIDVATLQGTGPGGAVVLADVERAAVAAREPPKPEAPRGPSAGVDTDGMRKAIALRMSRSKREIPHYYLGIDVDLGAANAWLEAYNAARPVTERIVQPALLLKATALAAVKYPELNGHYGPDGFVPADHVRLGVAISLRGGGLVVPGIERADEKPLAELMKDLEALVERARAGRLRASDLTDPTLTVTNLGAQGVPFVLPVIFPPQVAMVGFGRVGDRPCVVDRQVVARPMVTVTLAGDHRVSDGHRGGLFLRALDRNLQHPEAL